MSLKWRLYRLLLFNVMLLDEVLFCNMRLNILVCHCLNEFEMFIIYWVDTNTHTSEWVIEYITTLHWNLFNESKPLNFWCFLCNSVQLKISLFNWLCQWRFYKECPHPDEEQRRDLSKELGLEPNQIKFWFQNKRTQTKVIKSY